MKSEVRDQNDEIRSRRRVVALLLLSVFALTVAAEVEVVGAAGRTEVSVVRRVELDYHLVTADRDLEFEVEGPAWVRVYTRAWWPDGVSGRRGYGLSLWQEDAERVLEFEAGKSSSSYARNGRPVGQWRSFYVQVPPGRNRYRLALNRAPLDTVGVRFKFQAPRPWAGIALPGLDELVLVQGGQRETFRRLAADNPATFRLTGPCQVKVRARLNYRPELVGAQSFRLAVFAGDDELVGQNLRVTKSQVASWENAGGLVPSVEKTLRFRLPDGSHALRVELHGTLARDCGIRVETLAGEKYE